MKLLHQFKKAWPRVVALVFALFGSLTVWSQDTTTTGERATTQNETGVWYDQGWIWFVIIIIAVVLVLALTRKSGKGPMDRDTNRFKDRR